MIGPGTRNQTAGPGAVNRLFAGRGEMTWPCGTRFTTTRPRRCARRSAAFAKKRFYPIWKPGKRPVKCRGRSTRRPPRLCARPQLSGGIWRQRRRYLALLHGPRGIGGDRRDRARRPDGPWHRPAADPQPRLGRDETAGSAGGFVRRQNRRLAISEAEGGSDVASIRTRARRDGDHFVVDGQKMFISNGVRGDYYSVAVRTGGKAWAAFPCC